MRSRRVWIGVLVIVVFLVAIRLYMWLTAYDFMNVEIPIGRYKSPRSDQVNLFVSPDWIVGIDRRAREVKNYRLGGNTNPAQLMNDLRNSRIMIDGYLFFPEDLESIDGLRRILQHEMLKSDVQTNLTRKDMIGIWQNLGGDIVYKKQTSGVLAENAILDEGLNIAVKNGTNISGLATEFSFWITNLGSYVVETGNATQSRTKSEIIVYRQKGEKLQTVYRLEQLLNVTAQYVTTTEQMKYDVQVTVGSDFIRT